MSAHFYAFFLCSNKKTIREVLNEEKAHINCIRLFSESNQRPDAKIESQQIQICFFLNLPRIAQELNIIR